MAFGDNDFHDTLRRRERLAWAYGVTLVAAGLLVIIGVVAASATAFGLAALALFSAAFWLRRLQNDGYTPTAEIQSLDADGRPSGPATVVSPFVLGFFAVLALLVALALGLR